MFFLKYGDAQVGGHGAPDLRLNRVLAVAHKLYDSLVLIYQCEEKFYLATTFVSSKNGQGRQDRVFGQENQSLLVCWVLEQDTAYVFGVVLGNVLTVQSERFIADKTAVPAHLGQVNALGVRVAFGIGHTEGAGPIHLVKTSKVYVSLVHAVERDRHQDQDVRNIYHVNLAIADLTQGKNRASEVQQGVLLHRCLGLAKRRPVEQIQTQIAAGGIQRVDRILEIESQVIVQIKLTGTSRQKCGQEGPDSPVARLVGIGQGGAINAVAKSHCVQLDRVGSEHHFEVARALSPSQQSKSNDVKLAPSKSGVPHPRRRHSAPRCEKSLSMARTP